MDLTADDDNIDEPQNSHVNTINNKNHHKIVAQSKNNRVDAVVVNNPSRSPSRIANQPSKKRVKVIDNEFGSDDELQSGEVDHHFSRKNELKGAFMFYGVFIRPASFIAAHHFLCSST